MAVANIAAAKIEYETQYRLNNGIKDVKEVLESADDSQSKENNCSRNSADCVSCQVLKKDSVLKRYSDSFCLNGDKTSINAKELKALQSTGKCECFGNQIESEANSCLFDPECRNENSEGENDIQTESHKTLSSTKQESDTILKRVNVTSDGSELTSSQSEESVVKLRNLKTTLSEKGQTDTRCISAAFGFLKDENEENNKENNESNQQIINVNLQPATVKEINSERTSVISNISSLSAASVESDSSYSQTCPAGLTKDISSDDSGFTASEGNYFKNNTGVSCEESEKTNPVQSEHRNSLDGENHGIKHNSESDLTKGEPTASTAKGDNSCEQNFSKIISCTQLPTRVPEKGDNHVVENSRSSTHSVLHNENKGSEGNTEVDEKLPVLRKRSSKKSVRSLKTQMSSEGDSDDSSDEDLGVYAESHRNSHWIKVEEDGTLTVPGLPYTINEGEDTNSDGTTTTSEISTKYTDDKEDDVFGDDDSVFTKTHKRSESTKTTASESEFRNKFRYLRKCSVQRHDSQQQFYRMSTKYYEAELTITMEKDDSNADFGIHILDSHPAVISAVLPGSKAECAGVTAGHILISVNGVNVLAASHDEIICLIQQNPDSLTIAVGQSDILHSRDLQAPVLSGYLTKLASSGLIKLWRKRWCVLRQDNCLYYYKAENCKDPLGAIPLCNYSVSKALEINKDFSFKLEKFGAKSFYFAAESEESRKRWANTMTAAAQSTLKTESWLDVTSNNVGIPALSIRNPECTGYLYKMGDSKKRWKKRYCVLKDACIYYYKGIGSYSAQGVAHLHGYQLERDVNASKRHAFKLAPPEAMMRTFLFATENDTDRERWMNSMLTSIGRWQRISISK